MNKQVESLATAIEPITSGAVIMIGGFGGSGAPVELIHALITRFRDTGAPRALTVINNNAGNGHVGIAAMIEAGMITKMVCSFPRSSNADAFNEAYAEDRIELELVPQGTLAERIRAAGAGIPAFYTQTGFGTELAKGKVTAEFDGRHYVQERWLKADFALIKADRADRLGNLTYRHAARNFNPSMCMAAETTIVQAREVLEPGAIDSNTVVTPGIFVDAVVCVVEPEQEEALVREGRVF